MIATRKKIFLYSILVLAAILLSLVYIPVSATDAINSGNFSMSAFADGIIKSGSHKNCSAHGYRGLRMSPVSFPSPSKTFVCGEVVTVRLDSVNSVCGNTGFTTYFIPTGTSNASLLNSTTTVVRDNGYNGVVPVGSIRVYEKTSTGITTNYPLQIKLAEGYTGTASVTGYYKQLNGACSSDTAPTTFTFNNITCTGSCSCSGRDNVCVNGVTTSTTTNATSCQLGANCGYSMSSTTATFSTFVNNALGTLTYRDVEEDVLVSNPYSKEVALNTNIVQRTLVTDAYDGQTATATCSFNSGSGGGTSTSTSNTSSTASTTSTSTAKNPKINFFSPSQALVKKGSVCNYSWDADDVDRCSVIINNISQNLSGQGNTSKVSNFPVSTSNGLNQSGLITCVLDAVPPSTNSITISTTTLCRVDPDVIQR